MNETVYDVDEVGRKFSYLKELESNYSSDVTPSPSGRDKANLLSSQDDRGLHHPVIDLDRQGVRLVPSTTPGNFHLYLDKGITWPKYVILLSALAEAGIVEEKWAIKSIERGASFVRPPSVKKNPTTRRGY